LCVRPRVFNSQLVVAARVIAIPPIGATS
jgi:hypothetical protein